MRAPIDRCADRFADGLDPPPSITVSQWADRHRILPATSAEPGPWRTSRTPYLREIMDRLSPQDPCEIVVVMKGAQLGFSALAENWVGYSVHNDPSPMLLVQPTVNTAKDYAKDRINTLIASTPELREVVREQKSRSATGSTTMRKQFPGGFLVITGANSAVELRAKAIRRLILDEVDGYPADVDGEGDPVDLARKRTATFGNRKILLFSTPTIKGVSRIELEYEATDKRRFFVPCPICGEFQTLEWSQVRWQELGLQPHEAVYQCVRCGEFLANHRKGEMLARGEWRPTAEPANPRAVGYCLSGLYRPNGWRSWGDIAADWVKAKRSRDTALLRVLVNTDLAETWDLADGQSADPKTLIGRVEDYTETCPDGVCVLTAGVDIQGDRIELEVVGWGDGEESWSIDYRVLYGDPETADLWGRLDELLLRRFPHSRVPAGLPIAAAGVDAGFKTDLVYAFCKDRRTRRVWAVMGVANSAQRSHPIWPRRPSKPQKGKYERYDVGVDTAKETLYARLQLDEPGRGYCHFGSHCDEVYFHQLTAERLRTRYKNGRPVYFWWKPEGRRNEALDCRVYAMAAVKALLAMGLRFDGRSRRSAALVPSQPRIAPAQTSAAPPPPRPQPLPAGGSAPRMGRFRTVPRSS
jgi:phage terminase large subunit GpA-like protein